MTFEELLARDGRLVYKIRGASMEPMLRQDRDLFIVSSPSARLKKYDVALYKRGSSYVLHRVIEVKEDYYLIRGDNTFVLETVPDAAVIGVLTGFQRKGKYYGTTNPTYQRYVRLCSLSLPEMGCGVGPKGRSSPGNEKGAASHIIRETRLIGLHTCISACCPRFSDASSDRLERSMRGNGKKRARYDLSGFMRSQSANTGKSSG